MPPIAEEEDDQDLIGSQDGSSDNDDEAMRDADDGDVDNEDLDQDADADSPSNSQSSDGPGDLSQSENPDSTTVVDNLSVYRPSVRPECLTATTYDIVPTTAAPHSTSINAVTATADMRWVFSGGSDGYIRKFNWVESINSKLMLTVAQRHPFVDSVVKAGVLMTYWENMDANNIMSPVYSLAAQSEGLWLLSGLESGTIRLQSVRHDEGREIALLREHTSAVSVMNLTSDEASLLSGSWDKKVLDWDLNVGRPRRVFATSAGQISAIDIRPESSLPVPQDTIETTLPNGTYTSNNHAGTFGFINGTGGGDTSEGAGNNMGGSPADSLFGGDDSLFGDTDGNIADGGEPPSGAFAMDGDNFLDSSLANGVQAPDADVQGGSAEDSRPNGVQEHPEDSNQDAAPAVNIQEQPQTTDESAPTGLPHAEELEPPEPTQDTEQPESLQTSTENVFLAASIDGTIRVWDRRQPEPVARISPRNVPPWCMNACWSPDGNYIYAGRRNGTVEEFSLHKGLRESERTFKFPQGSGAVTALKPMPNGRHLVCASHDILRLYDLRAEPTRHSTVPFLIIPGHRTGVVSQLYLDRACRFMISVSGNRGWEGLTTEVLLGYEINIPSENPDENMEKATR
ncbi:hypothetical protein VTN49DRAFT_5132 [Thermomyces lanuginosus]|uniref:uncharacterized protein n=1 Tax=Thermomyces lanuginosus TaxID=5541 RepID=UPI0037420913